MLDEELIKKLKLNTIIDWRKAPYEPLERAQIIQSLLEEEKVSIRELARQLQMPKSTLQDWWMWNKLTKEQYGALKKAKVSSTQIYKALRRKGQAMTPEQIVERQFVTDLQRCLETLRPYLRQEVVLGPENTRLLSELKNVLNRLEMLIEKPLLRQVRAH